MIPGIHRGPGRAPLVLTCVVAAGLTAAWCPRSDAATAQRRVAAMGTYLDVAVGGPDRAAALAASEAATAEVRRVEDLLSTWRDDSPLARLNATPAGRETALDPEMFAVLSDVFAWSAATGRAFDPTVGPLVRAWDLRGKGRIPSHDERVAAVAACGSDRFRLDRSRMTVTRLDASAGIEEGAWGKGYALDRAADRLRAGGTENALLDLGGQVLALGKNDEGGDWTIAVAHPRDRARPVVVMALPELSAATSGNSERARDVASGRIGHVLDPRTGRSAEDFGSVTVLAPSALVADVLSTAFFVLGPREGLSLSATLRSKGTRNEVLFLVEHGDALEAIASPGISPLVISVDPTIHGLPANRP